MTRFTQKYNKKTHPQIDFYFVTFKLYLTQRRKGAKFQNGIDLSHQCAKRENENESDKVELFIPNSQFSIS